MNAISKDYARSRAGQYTSRNGSKSVPRYDRIESCVAVHSQHVNCLVNTRFFAFNARLLIMLITCDTAFYAIMSHDVALTLMQRYPNVACPLFPSPRNIVNISI